jgi:endonuclease/exonuclease/phosphatase family metal-dependent hydrolase
MKRDTLRFLTLNLWGDNGPWQERLALCAEGLAVLQPDVVTLQEVRDVPGRVPNQAAELARRLGFHHVFAPSTAWGGGHEGLAVLSRFPIGGQDFRPLPHSTETEGRIVLSARIDSELGEIWVHTTHLSFREHEGAKREDQVLFLDDVMMAHRNDNPQVLTGDFNATPSSDEIRWLTGLTTLAGRRVAYQDAWDRLHPGEMGITWARANPYVDVLHWLRPDRRLDYVFVTPVRRDRRGTVVAARIVFDEPKLQPGGERLYASDHFGVLAEVRLAGESVK